MIAGLVGDVVDGASGGVLTEGGALGAFQHFHPLQVEGRADRQGGERQRLFVEVDAHRRAAGQGGVLEADAPDRIDVGAVVIGRREEARDDLLEILGAGDPQLLEIFTRSRLDRHADGVDVLFTLLRGDDQFLDRDSVGGHDVRRRPCRRGGRGRLCLHRNDRDDGSRTEQRKLLTGQSVSSSGSPGVPEAGLFPIRRSRAPRQRPPSVF